jgi:hypothetical protein
MMVGKTGLKMPCGEKKAIPKVKEYGRRSPKGDVGYSHP